MPGDVRLAGDYAEIADGLILTEGPAIHRGRYGKYYRSVEEMRGLSISRDGFEFSLFREFHRRNKPVLGIGRGMDIINIALGGTLGDAAPERPVPVPVTVRKDSELGRRFPRLPDMGAGKRPPPEKLGGALKPWALGPEEIPEGIELPGSPVFGVQWRPEWENLILEDILAWFAGAAFSVRAAPGEGALP
jgi:putative glutamine amidotransferase